ncbi:MAG: hypothetical protein JEZ08_01285 [Clostridiales bacterium]|nr:hypothetical protein [Clostridiales bacterium]
MENGLEVKEDGLKDIWKSDEIVTYLNEHIESFEPTDDEVDFFDKYLKLNKRGKVKLGGFLLFLMIAITIGIFSNSIIFITNFKYYTVLGILIVGGLLVSQTLAYIAILRKLKIGRILLIIQYILFFILNIIGFTPSAIGSLITSVLIIIYVLKSKRVKFTLVERFSRDAVHYE